MYTQVCSKCSLAEKYIPFFNFGTGWIAGVVFTILEACAAGPVKIPISERLCNSAAINGVVTPNVITLKSLTVDETRVQEVAVRWGTGENWLYLLVEYFFVVFQERVSFIGAVWWKTRLKIDFVQHYCVILRVEHEYWCLDVTVDIL